MSEKLSDSIKNNNGPTPPNAWDFVKDTSFTHNSAEQKSAAEPTKPDRTLQAHELIKLFGISAEQADAFQNLPPEQQADELRVAIGELIDDPNDQEQIDYYVSHTGKIEQLRNRFSKDYSRDDLVRSDPNEPNKVLDNKIVALNALGYDTLLQRKKDIEQAFPDITSSQNTPARMSIPDRIKDEYRYSIKLMELLTDPIDELSDRDTSNDTYNILKGNLVVESSHRSNAETYAEELKSLRQQNHDLVESHEHPVENVHKLIATWQTELTNVSNMQQYHDLEAKVKPYITPEESPYGIRDMLTIKEKISRPLRQKYIEIRLQEATKETQDLQGKHPDEAMPNPNTNSGLTLLENVRRGLAIEQQQLWGKIMSLDKKITNGQNQLDSTRGHIKSPRQLRNNRILRERLAENRADMAKLRAQLEDNKSNLDLVNDKIAFLKTTQEIAALRQEQDAQAN